MKRFVSCFLLLIIVLLCLGATCRDTVVNTEVSPVDEVKPVPGNFSFNHEWTYDFNEKKVGWGFGDWTFDDNECEFVKDNAVFEDGILSLIISKKDQPEKTAEPGKAYWGAEYFTDTRYLYGKFTVRMKVNSIPGVVTSFFLAWYDADTSGGGWELRDESEIDIEFAGDNRTVYYTIHYFDEYDMYQSNSVKRTLPFDASEDFHVYEIEWTPNYIKHSIDGVEYHVFDDIYEIYQMRNAQTIRMNYWINEAWGGKINPDLFPAKAEYDYISYSSLVIE